MQCGWQSSPPDTPFGRSVSCASGDNLAYVTPSCSGSLGTPSSKTSPRTIDECTGQVCQGTPQKQCHVIERDVKRQVRQSMCPQPDRTRRLHLEMSRGHMHLGHENVNENSGTMFAFKGCWRKLSLRIQWCNVKVGPWAIEARQAGVPFKLRLVHCNSNVPAA